MAFDWSWRRWRGKGPALEQAERVTRNISSIEELDEVLKEVHAAHAVSDDAVRAALQSFRYVIDVDDLPANPFSDAYKQYQFDLYERIAGRPYRVDNERSSFLSDDVGTLPFPYYTQSWKTVSDHIIMMGLIVKTLALPSKASILEFGPGWGNTTLMFAQMGYDVTAIDIEQRFLDVVAFRCKDLANPPRLVCGDFAQIREMDDRFDAILFNESFHHCSDHNGLLAALPDRLKPGGRILFAGEPVDEALPMPWGLRLDGMSVWSTRCFGWLELGFRETYFQEALKRAGFAVEKVQYSVTDFGTMFTARR
jgi:2-polyprenyl-3-methyl-5-hydroxy-6-metoxy-1,4-benzoquinol methylase